MSKRILLLIISSVLTAPTLGGAEVTRSVPVSVPASHGMYVFSKSEIWLADTFKKVSSPSKIYHQNINAPQGLGMAGMAKHPTEDIYSFCDLAGSKVILQNTSGPLFKTYTIPNPWNARWTPSGENLLIVGYAGTLFNLSLDAVRTEILNNLDAPFDVAPIDDHSFWISEQGAQGDGQVCLYRRTDAQHEFSKVVCNQNVKLRNPEGLWPLANGAVLAVDTEAGRLVKIKPSGETTVLEENLGLPILVQALGQNEWVVYTNRSAQGAALVFGRSPNL